MGKQGFEMAAQVRKADDIIWTKFLLLLSKLLYSRINNHSNDCANIEMGDNWREVLFKTKVEIIKNKLTSIRSLKFKKMHEADTKKRQIYYTKQGCSRCVLFPSLLGVKYFSNLLGETGIFSGWGVCTALNQRNCFFFERFWGYKWKECKESFMW